MKTQLLFFAKNLHRIILKKIRIKSFFIVGDCIVGDNVSIGRGTYVFENVRIGRNSYINKYSNIENCDIGCYCSISSNVQIGPAEHNYTSISTSPFLSEKAAGMHTVIEDNVMIGINSVIKAGVTIGQGAVVGAGSIVTKDVKPYTIVCGNPAKQIRKRFSPATIERLRLIEWDTNPETIHQQIKDIING